MAHTPPPSRGTGAGQSGGRPDHAIELDRCFEDNPIVASYLSMQELANCNMRYNQGCVGVGGNPLFAFYFVDRIGVTSVRNYPYRGRMDPCQRVPLGRSAGKKATETVLETMRVAMLIECGHKGDGGTVQKKKVFGRGADLLREQAGVLHEHFFCSPGALSPLEEQKVPRSGFFWFDNIIMAPIKALSIGKKIHKKLKNILYVNKRYVCLSYVQILPAKK
jgi:hypothetical protein